MSYADYSATELVQDTYFQRWVLAPDESVHTFWKNWLLEHPEKKDEVEEAIRMIALLEFDQDFERNEHFVSVWNQVYAKTLSKQNPSAHWRAAAVWIGILLVSSLGAVWLFTASAGYSRHTTAQKEAFTLPDGSTVTLNKHSSIAYRVSGTGDREVTLRGEGFFEVTQQKKENSNAAKFTVYTETAAIEVLGTSFNVSEFDQKTQVVLSTGKVKVTSPDQEVVRLEPGELVEVGIHQPFLKKKKVDSQLYASWVNGQAIFERAALHEILDWVEDRYDKSVHVDSTSIDLDSLTFTATIPDGDLATLLEALAITYRLDIQHTDQHIVIGRQPH